jgi:helix-turn-helix protein
LDSPSAIRREARLTRKQVANALEWPQTRIEHLETGRIKTDGERFGGDHETPSACAFDLIASSVRPSLTLITPTGVLP